MKLFSAQLSTETNTFAPAPTGLAGFEAFGVHHGTASTLDAQGWGSLLRTVRDLAESEGHAFVESLSAFAQPSGRTVRSVYENLRDEILDDLREAMPVDGVILFLHGAMAARGYDDCEGDLLARVREIVGPEVPVGAELDLHCHITALMLQSADVLIAYKQYPHTDMQDRAREVYRLVTAQARGEIRPTTALFDCRMVGMWHTTKEPMAGFVRRMQDLEGRDGVLSISLGHGFPWGDVPESGAKLWVVTDNDPAKAEQLAGQLGREFWSLREVTRGAHHSIDAALDAALAVEGGPVVLADVADNPGGGAPSDSTFILRRMLERGVGDAVLGFFWDVGAIQTCVEAGVGARFELRVGGKCGVASGQPVDLPVTVRVIRENHGQNGLGYAMPMGTTVWVEAPNGLHLVLCSVRNQVYGTDGFTALGLTLEDKKLVVVKSTQHFHAAFAPLAKQVLYVATPGAISPDFAAIEYRVRDLHYWPRVADPHRGQDMAA